jgi:hypothetical protein
MELLNKTMTKISQVAVKNLTVMTDVAICDFMGINAYKLLKTCSYLVAMTSHEKFSAM